MVPHGSDDERRRMPRFECGGDAKIICLPSEGLILPAQLRDLSLGGCCLEASSRLDRGSRTEVVLRVNKAIFRALSQVRAIRGQWQLGLEFLQLSLAGQQELREVVERLARLQEHMQRIAAARREEQREWLLREMDAAKLNGLRRLPLVHSELFSEEQESRVPETEHRPEKTAKREEDSSVDIFI